MILIVSEARNGQLHRASWEAVAAAQQLAGQQTIEAVVLGSNVNAAAAELSQAAITTVHVVDTPALDAYTPDAYVEVVKQIVERLKPDYVLLAHTYQTRDFAPKLAARLDR